MAGFFSHGASWLFSGVTVGGVLDFELPTEAKEEVETSDMDSNFRRQFVPGMIDAGAVDITLRMVPGDVGQEAIIANKDSASSVVPQVITAPSHVTPRPQWAFDAYVQSVGGTLFWEGSAAERVVSLRVSSGVSETII